MTQPDDSIGTGGEAEAIAAIRGARRLCFFAHYHPRGRVTDAVIHYLTALAEQGFTVVVLSTATLDEGERARLAAACRHLVLRENYGLDFGGWQDSVARFFPIEAELLLLANDSVYGPLADLGHFLDTLLATSADFYGAVETGQFGAHLQSWFVLLRPSAYRSPAFAAIMAATIPRDIDKWTIIERYELGLTRALVAAGLRYHAAYRPARDGLIAAEVNFNPGQVLWRELIDRAGIPFIKVELLRDLPIAAGSVDDWPEHVPAALQPMIATDLALRRTRSARAIRLRQLAGSGAVQATYWAVMRPFLRRDFGPADTAGPDCIRNAARFHAIKSATHRLRRRFGKLLG